MLLTSLQSQLEQHYDLKLPYEVSHFVSHDPEVAYSLAKQAQYAGTSTANEEITLEDETLFISQTGDSLEFTVYLDAALLGSAEVNADPIIPDAHPCISTTVHSLDNLCSIVEGVSHAVCLLWHAHHERQIRPVDLELQADIDKFLILLDANATRCDTKQLHENLFARVRYLAEPGSELHHRYQLANESAAHYCSWLCNQYIDSLDVNGLKHELARFYRLSGTAKFERIKRLH